MISKEDILMKLHELKPFLNKEFAVKEIGLFGSFANNSYNDDSDIDLIVELENPIGWKFFWLNLKIRGSGLVKQHSNKNL